MGEAFAFVSQETSKAVVEFDDDSSNYHHLLSSLNLHWKKHLLEKSLWTAEKLELQARINLLQGQLRSYASVNVELVERIKILESALLHSRGQKQNEDVSVAPTKFQPDLAVTDLLTKKQIQRGRHVLQNYLNEINIIDDSIKQMNPNKLIENNDDLKHMISNQLNENNNFKQMNLNQLIERDTPLLPNLTKTNYTSDSKNSKNVDNDDDQALLSQLRSGLKKSKGGMKSKLLDDIDIEFGDINTVDSLPSKLTTKNSLKILKNLAPIKVDKNKTAHDVSSDFDMEIINDLENIFEMDDMLSSSENTATNSRPRSRTITSEKSYTWVTTNTLWGHTEIVRSIDFHPQTKILASSSDDGLVCIWNFEETSKLEITPKFLLRGHSSPVLCCSFNHLGDILFSSDLEGNINVWSIGDQNILQTYKYSDEAVWSISYDLQSNLLLSMSADGVCCLWKPSQTTPFDSFAPYPEDDDRRYLGAVFDSKDNNRIICISEKDVLVYYLPEKKVISTVNPFESDNSDNNGNISLNKSDNPTENHITCFSVNPCEPLVAVGCANNNVYIIDIDTASVVKSFTPHSHSVSAISYDPTGQILSTGDISGAIHIWDKGYTCIQSINSAHRSKVNDGVMAIAFHKNLKFMASCGSDDFVKLYI